MGRRHNLLALVAVLLHTQSSKGAPFAQQPFSIAQDAADETKSVIIQMFEWSWESIAEECTEFIGPAGYGYVQGVLYIHLGEIKWPTIFPRFYSESRPGARHGSRVVDRLPARLVRNHVETRQPYSIRQYDRSLPYGRRESHSWYVAFSSLLLRTSMNCLPRHYL